VIAPRNNLVIAEGRAMGCSRLVHERCHYMAQSCGNGNG
jgi:hypothetical protein